ncbi:BREX-1 system phosphatase PglZ type A [Dielma fastidiosa]|uniref:BREX-1 system phosphatase PglZ type A n=1 Tax=Dielma fastidiosa TaxID=1034346 RepID=UPI0035665753
MAELNLKQIIDRLNAEFTGETRKLVFWYDDKAEFAEDMETVELQNAKIYHLQPDNQFYTKYFLERVDKTTNYLIYAPFPKPDVRDNHLEDTMLYSRRFFADRASLLSVDLGIEEKYKPVIEKHIKFFANKERTQRFYDLEIENFNEENILVGLLSAVCKARTCSFEEVVRIVLTDGELVDNAFLQEFEKYDLLSAFWQLCEQHFGYTDTKPSLERLLVTLFVTYTGRYVQAELPAAWRSFVSYKSGNIIAFLDSLMNSVLYRDKYDALSAHVAKGLNVLSTFAGMRVDDLVECDTFLAVDQVLVKWLISRLVSEDIGAIVNGFTIPELCEKRAKMHFGRKTGKTYQMLSSAYSMVKKADYHAADGLKPIIDRYLAADYNMDQQYRKFYYYYDQLESTESFEPLRELVENIYTNEYLACLLPAWNAGIQQDAAFSAIPLQREFYNANLRYTKERTVVIISDAMRYEVGQELFARMQDDPKCTAKLSVQLSVLPSYTRLGMAALLPHKTLEMTDDFQVLADGILCDNLAGRQQVLQSYNPDSVCVQFDDIKNLKVAELRDVLTKRQIIYVYHNQIDARGDKANTEDEVFNACEEAVQEIMDLIHRISVSGNTYHFIVTADHGFIYKRDKLTESDKISGKSAEKAFVNRRFIVSKAALEDDGIDHMSMGRVLGNEDSKVVSYPVSSNVFKVAGGGANYVHGGSSPQEMLVPVLEFKMERGHMETKNAEIALVSIVHKITNLITSMDFIQSDAVSDTVKAAKYRIFFLSEDNEKISNENSYVADSREENAQKRIFRMRFTFKNKKYDKDKQYYLVVYDEESGLEQWRQPVIMDIAFADDFGFGF